jgi:T-complex protein 1 subunit theta
LTAEEVGHCDVVEVTEIGSDRCTVFRQEAESSTATRTASIVLRAATLNYLDDLERAIDDGVNAIKSLTKDGRLLAGAAATETALAGQLQVFGDKTPGLAQYAIKKYAEALEVIPATLAENAGMDASETLAKLQGAHQAGLATFGVDIEVSPGGEGARVRRAW